MCVWSTLRSHNQSLAPALLHAWVLLRSQDQSRMESWFRVQAFSRAQDLLGARALPSLDARVCPRARTQKIARELVQALLLSEC